MNGYKCPMCGSSMTVRPTAQGEVIDCDNDNQECNYQVDKENWKCQITKQ